MTIYLVDREYDGIVSAWTTRALAQHEADRLFRAILDGPVRIPPVMRTPYSVVEIDLDKPASPTS